jgi:aromatic ring-opening dioxygenase catalytic subunit (LigB family)
LSANEFSNHPSPVLYLPHGGGPLPVLGDQAHAELVLFLGKIATQLDQPSAIIVVSAHWEEQQPTLTYGSNPKIIYDYYGFPAAAYEIEYPAPGEPELAKEAFDLLQSAGLGPRLDQQRGFDHGLFIPLKLMYPSARIPCIQLSLLNNLDPARHLAMGRAIASLRRRNVLFVGSGMSSHNMQALSSPDQPGRHQSALFASWLIEACISRKLPASERERRLLSWSEAPSARFCHPREEHLLPLHVCYGIACGDTPTARVVFNRELMGQQVTSLLWAHQ